MQVHLGILRSVGGGIKRALWVRHKLKETLIKMSDTPPWLCHSDARQVSDLPKSCIITSKVSDLFYGWSQTSEKGEGAFGKS